MSHDVRRPARVRLPGPYCDPAVDAARAACVITVVRSRPGHHHPGPGLRGDPSVLVYAAALVLVTWLRRSCRCSSWWAGGDGGGVAAASWAWPRGVRAGADPAGSCSRPPCCGARWRSGPQRRSWRARRTSWRRSRCPGWGWRLAFWPPNPLPGPATPLCVCMSRWVGGGAGCRHVAMHPHGHRAAVVGGQHGVRVAARAATRVLRGRVVAWSRATLGSPPGVTRCSGCAWPRCPRPGHAHQPDPRPTVCMAPLGVACGGSRRRRAASCGGDPRRPWPTWWFPRPDHLPVAPAAGRGGHGRAVPREGTTPLPGSAAWWWLRSRWRWWAVVLARPAHRATAGRERPRRRAHARRGSRAPPSPSPAPRRRRCGRSSPCSPCRSRLPCADP
ncbi:hypothetical protein QJS66_12465 [Kocuria rhizophila]|nr:hypothetical protein QJS66_12465 [Kocuria rhizophila]